MIIAKNVEIVIININETDYVLLVWIKKGIRIKIDKKLKEKLD
jgi:hypothetical protein